MLMEIEETKLNHYVKKEASKASEQNSPTVPECQESVLERSEREYMDIVRNVVDYSKSSLQSIQKYKINLRDKLVDFCTRILTIQLLAVIMLLIFHNAIAISDAVFLGFISSVFVETLGAIIIMVKYAFQSGEEVKIIDILNAVVKNYQKFSNNGKNKKE